jgi:Tfp pilus assembly protein PilF
MSKYDIDLDYVILDVDITIKELFEIKVEADKIISDYNESKEKRAVAYLKKVQCLRKLGAGKTASFIYYEEQNFFYSDNAGITIEKEDLNKLLKYVLGISPNMPEAFVQLGLLNSDWFMSNDDQEIAVNLFTKAIQLKPDYAAAFNNRAMIFNRILLNYIEDTDNSKILKNYRSAVTDLTEAIRIRPCDALYHLNRGTFYSKLGENREAAEDFTNALYLASDVLKNKFYSEVNILKLRGKEYLKLNEYNKAIDDFTESLRLIPDDKDTLLLRGKAYYLKGEKEKTREIFNEYLNQKRKTADTEGRSNIFKLTGLRPEEI